MKRVVQYDDEGLGLGLATCEKIVRGHGGKIWCEPVASQGSIFVVSLPKPTEEIVSLPQAVS